MSEIVISPNDTAAPGNIKALYENSIVRARRGIFPEILLACAAAPHDAEGWFSAAGVRAELERIVRREVRGVMNQVSALTEPGRGTVLLKRGAGKAAQYRFVEPALEAYILARGLETGWTTAGAPVWAAGEGGLRAA